MNVDVHTIISRCATCQRTKSHLRQLLYTQLLVPLQLGEGVSMYCGSTITQKEKDAIMVVVTPKFCQSFNCPFCKNINIRKKKDGKSLIKKNEMRKNEVEWAGMSGPLFLINFRPRKITPSRPILFLLLFGPFFVISLSPHQNQTGEGPAHLCTHARTHSHTRREQIGENALSYEERWAKLELSWHGGLATYGLAFPSSFQEMQSNLT